MYINLNVCDFSISFDVGTLLQKHSISITKVRIVYITPGRCRERGVREKCVWATGSLQ